MSVTGVEEVSGRLAAFFQDVKINKSEGALTELLIQGAAYAADMTPIDTSTLINSQGREVMATATGWRGVVFYGAHYAPYVHNASGKLKGQPREDFGVTRAGVSFGGGSGKGNYWDPNGEPQFLVKGMERAVNEDFEEIIRRYYGV